MPKKFSTKTAILRAATALIAEHGFHGTSVQMVADMAGVGVGSLYRYFRDKDELIHAVCEAVREKVETHIQTNAPEGLPLRERFRLQAENIIFYFLDHPADLRFMEQYLVSPYSGLNKNRIPSLGSMLRTNFSALLEAAKAAKVVIDLPMEILDSLTLGPLIAMLNAHLAGKLELNEMTIRGTINVVWDAITVRGVQSCR